MIDESKPVETSQNPNPEDLLNQAENPASVSAQEPETPSPDVDNGAEPAQVQEDSASEGIDPSSEPSSETTDPAAHQADVAQAALLAEVLASKELELDSIKQSYEEVKAQYQRLGADFDNFRKRTQKEKGELEDQTKCKTLQELLPVVDNFERARSQIKPQNDGEMTIHKSYQSVYKQLVDCLKRIGVSPMRAEGKEFDPNLHEAVMREATSEYAEGTVTEELMRGYLLNDRVLRHAMVKVAAAPEDEPALPVEDATEQTNEPEVEESES
ncbi:MAG: nucleotide exchange factor GrpE [Roseofilum sp. SBFL]|uniref:nucleotide exchange factor GrpE n=1 Tax=unclassified Roseofilum TaxID=2620099 RepID=UPI001B08E4A6|nr:MULTISPECIES: nucleotide exchange factor GrpE [unclassified Roseofilum]MBP0015573.1 nucleotide exchange factor GrpE [Roseofilum sp. SID3]MBP0022670.1 nucleotide exchange factor GrpE [Roseofilum sp. SID2]MBP0039230.1 nucleotide exchange factor GrpE [Roseofilum sp. SID1]MBP0042688.1 nucleotide exchange factor GrpE [Roseofilum sp. SBFL]